MKKGEKIRKGNETRLFVRLSVDEKELLEKIASHYSISKSELIRILIKNEAIETFENNTLHLLLT